MVIVLRMNAYIGKSFSRCQILLVSLKLWLALKLNMVFHSLSSVLTLFLLAVTIVGPPSLTITEAVQTAFLISALSVAGRFVMDTYRVVARGWLQSILTEGLHIYMVERVNLFYDMRCHQEVALRIL